MKSVGGKLTVSLIVLLLFVCGGLGGLSYINSTQSLVNQVELGLQEKALDTATYIEERFLRSLTELEAVAAHEEIESMEWDKQRVRLEQDLNRLDYLALAIVTPDGVAQYLDGSTLELGDRDYVQKAFAGQSNMSDVIISRATNEPVMMLATPIYNKNDIVGVLIARIDGYYLSEVTDTVTFGETGFAFIVNEKGTFLGHRDRNLVLEQTNYIEEAKEEASLSELGSIIENLVSQDQGIVLLKENSSVSHVSFATLSNGWTIAVGADESEMLSGLKQLQQILLISTVIIILIGLGMALFMSRQISNPIKAVVGVGKYIAQGDFTQNLPEKYQRRQDELGELSQTFKLITENMKNMISKVNESANRVNQAAEDMDQKAEQTTIIAKAIDSVVSSVMILDKE